jgi:hypothetical protein
MPWHTHSHWCRGRENTPCVLILVQSLQKWKYKIPSFILWSHPSVSYPWSEKRESRFLSWNRSIYFELPWVLMQRIGSWGEREKKGVQTKEMRRKTVAECMMTPDGVHVSRELREGISGRIRQEWGGNGRGIQQSRMSSSRGEEGVTWREQDGGRIQARN